MRSLSLEKTFPYLLIAVGVIGLLCSFIITYDKLQLLQNPHYVPSCNLNPIISCGSVMQSKQSDTFGFPNSLIGLAAFPIVLCVGVAMLAGARFKRWFWLGLQAGTVFGLGMVYWLFFESTYRIHALCPFCIATWVVTITGFWYVLLYNVDAEHITVGAGSSQTIYCWIRRHHLDILVTWFLIIAALILKHFWYYYGHYLR